MSPLISAARFIGSEVATDDRLTVLLTLRDRVPFTRRWLEYANQTRFPFSIVLADGGAGDAVANEISGNRYRHLALEYLRFTPDRGSSDYYHKLRVATERIVTPFCMLADNDDFFSIEGIRRCLAFLETRQDFSACQGEWVGFRVSSEREFVSAKSVLFSKAYRPFHDFADANGDDRLASVARTNVQFWYAVARTEVLRDAFVFVDASSLGDLYLLELVVQFAMLARGKVKCLRTPFYFRQINTIGSSNDQATAREGLLHERILFSSFSDDLQKIKRWVVESCLNHSANGSVSEQRVEDALNRFVLGALAVYFQPTTGRGALKRRLREAVRRWVVGSSVASRLVSRLHDGARGQPENRLEYRAEMVRIREFMRTGESGVATTPSAS